MKISCIQDSDGPLSNDARKQVTRYAYASRNRSSSRLPSPVCDCNRENRSSGFSFAFRNLKFDFQQQIPGKHRRSCRFFGIDGQTQRRVNAQFPFKLTWLSARMTLACMEFAIGTSSPGCSVRLKNVVPAQHSPVLLALQKTAQTISTSRSTNETIELLEGAEREILSLYKERQASPGDVDEAGLCHVKVGIGNYAHVNGLVI